MLVIALIKHHLILHTVQFHQIVEILVSPTGNQPMLITMSKMATEKTQTHTITLAIMIHMVLSTHSMLACATLCPLFATKMNTASRQPLLAMVMSIVSLIMSAMDQKTAIATLMHKLSLMNGNQTTQVDVFIVAKPSLYQPRLHQHILLVMGLSYQVDQAHFVTILTYITSNTLVLLL